MLNLGLVLAFLGGIAFVHGGYFGDVHEDFCSLCVAILLPATDDNKPQLETFRIWWNFILNNAGKKLFPNETQTNYLSKAEAHCAKMKPDNDPICAYRDFVNIGKNMTTDLLTIEQTMVNSTKTPSFYYRAYCMSWLEHPRMHNLGCTNNNHVLWEFMGELSKVVLKKDTNTLTNMKNVFSSSQAKGLRREIEKTDCGKEASKDFCELKYFTEIADKIDLLFKAYGAKMWNTSRLVYSYAIEIHFFGVKLKAPHATRPAFVPTNETIVKNWMGFVIGDVVDSMRKWGTEFDHLIRVGELLPPADYLPCDTFALFPEFNKTVCQFSGTMYPLKPYIQGLIVSSKENRKSVSTAINYKKYLNQKQFEAILDMTETIHYTLVQIGKKLQNELHKSTADIQKYFHTTADFDQKIANKDLITVTSYLPKYLKQADETGAELDKLLQEVIAGAWFAVVGDVIEATLILSLRVAAACNPVKLFVAGAGAYADVVEATQALAQAMAKLASMNALSVAVQNLAFATSRFIAKINKSEQMLKPTRVLIAGLNRTEKTSEFKKAKDQFIELYGNYVPAVSVVDVKELSTYWEVVVNEGCNILDSTTGAVSAAAKALVHGQGLCLRAKIKVARLTAVFAELVEWQRTMMGTLLSYMRATATYNAANVINEFYNFTEPNTIDLQLMAGFSMLCYKVAIYSAMDSYCNILQYQEGGTEIYECQKGTRTLTTLLGRSVKNACNHLTMTVNIPTRPAHANDSAFIDLERLYAGKITNFKIPNAQWLVDHHWIAAHLKDSKFFVRRFELYLPTISAKEKMITVTANATTDNRLEPPKGTEYVLQPQLSLPPFTYREGQHAQSCGQVKLTNFYKDGCRDVPDICPLTSGAITPMPNDVYPSIFVRWQLRIRGYTDAKLTVPASNFFLRARLHVCKIYVEPKLAGRRSTRATAKTKCCGNGQYFDESIHNCTACPPGSESKYNGLFCGNITQLVLKDITGYMNDSTKDPFFTFQEATNKCSEMGTSITTKADMDRAVSLGYDSCACGWMSDQTVRAPKWSANCAANIGVKSGCTGRTKWPVYCGTNF